MEEKITDSTAVYFLKRMINRFNDDNVTALAAESTYYFILGLIPFMIFFVNAMLFFAAPQVEPYYKGSPLLTSCRSLSRCRPTSTVSAGKKLHLAGCRSWLPPCGQPPRGLTTLIRSMDCAFYGDRDKQSYYKVKTSHSSSRCSSHLR